MKSEPKFALIAALADDSWSVDELSQYRARIRASSGGTFVEFGGVALLKFLPAPRKSHPTHPYDLAPTGLSAMTGYPDDHRFYGTRVEVDRPATFVLRTPDGTYVVLARGGQLVEDGCQKHF